MNEVQLRQKLNNAQSKVKQILGQTKNPQVASEVDHTYDDKYLLSEFICNMALASQVSCLNHLGLTSESLVTLKEWCNAGDTVSLRFRSEEKCTFLRTETRQEDSGVEHVTEGTFFGKISSKVVTTIKEYIWKVEVAWEIIALKGVGVESTLRLCGRKGEHVIKTTTDTPPHPEIKSPAIVLNLDITWFLKQLNNNGGSSFSPMFSINRQHQNCATPFQNPDTRAALTYESGVLNWCRNIQRYINSDIFGKLNAETKKSLNSFHSLNNDDNMFVPIMPIFQNNSSSFSSFDPITSSSNAAEDNMNEKATETNIFIAYKQNDAENINIKSVLLDVSSIHKFLNEENRLIVTRMGDLNQEFPKSSGSDLVTEKEASLVMLCGHMTRVCGAWSESSAYIESMLRSQLIAAIGHEVTPTDFDNYMSFHHNKFFNDTFKPKPMVYSIRRSGLHSPEGTVSIERMSASSSSSTESNANKAIETFCSSRSSSECDMGFSINAATRISFSGERHLHGWLRHDFSGTNESGEKVSLNARARQFSGFIVIIGQVLDANNIDPQHAFLVQNRDEIEVPLSVSTIPTAKEFKDSIQSLSPEQKRFAEAFRSMQLGATLMGVLVIQIKPQLEAVLNLPPDSLTKEIKLTKDLFSLFVDYQIPSDLLKFSEDCGQGQGGGGDLMTVPPTAFKVNAVKGHVSAMLEMVSEFKNEEIVSQYQSHAYSEPASLDDLFGGAPRQQSLSFGAAPQPQVSGGFSFGAAPQPQVSGGFSFGGAPQPAMMAMGGPPSGKGFGFGGKGGSRGGARNRRLSSSTAPPPPPPAGGPPPPPMAPPPAAKLPPPAQTASASPKENPRPQPSMLNQANKDQGDFSCVPEELDSRALELDHSIRPTIVKPSDSWNKKAGAALVASKKNGNTTPTVVLGSEEQKTEKDRAFDLLDALTRSGSLPLSHASLHVIVCATLSFDDSVVDTVIKKNVNPIERAERSSMVMASTVHGLDRHDSSPLVNPTQLSRAMDQSPLLFSSFQKD